MILVHGLDKFREFFAEYNDKYVIIGGTACSIAMQTVGADFRATKDIDIVLTVDALSTEFYKVFWTFIRAGEYSTFNKSSDKDKFYRFHSPKNLEFPFMIELFAPDLEGHFDSETFPIKWEEIESEDTASLSAILLDTDYYEFIKSGRREVDGVTIIGAEHIIPLKGKAWMDHVRREAAGEKVDSKLIKKHKNDIIRLYSILTIGQTVALPESIKADVLIWLDMLSKDELQPKTFSIDKTLQEVVTDLTSIFIN